MTVVGSHRGPTHGLCIAVVMLGVASSLKFDGCSALAAVIAAASSCLLLLSMMMMIVARLCELDYSVRTMQSLGVGLAPEPTRPGFMGLSNSAATPLGWALSLSLCVDGLERCFFYLPLPIKI